MCEVTCNSVDYKWYDQRSTSLFILSHIRMTGVSWLIQEKFRCFINLYTMHSELYWTQEMMVKMSGVDALMEY